MVIVISYTSSIILLFTVSMTRHRLYIIFITSIYINSYIALSVWLLLSELCRQNSSQHCWYWLFGFKHNCCMIIIRYTQLNNIGWLLNNICSQYMFLFYGQVEGCTFNAISSFAIRSCTIFQRFFKDSTY